MGKPTKRIKGMTVISLIFLLALAGRLYYIQIVCGDALREGAQGQQVIQIQFQKDRGTIYDRNMIPLTDNCLSYYYLLPRSEDTADLEKLMKQIGGSVSGSKGEDYVVYKAERFNKEVNRKLTEEYGAYVFCSGSRYDDDQLAAHLIGYVSGSDKTGEAGLEKMFQYRLSTSPARLLMMGNGIGEPIRGIGVTRSEDRQTIEPSALVTTIDAALQARVEKIMQEKQVTGAVVIMQPGTGQILAMASTPTFNPNQMEQYLSSDQGELLNKAVQGQYPPGSVFKIVVAAAALESGKVALDETFDCSGSVEVNGVKLSCDDHPEGHGRVNFEEAFALSCNGFFAAAASKIGSETIIDMAERMGLGRAVIDGFPDEETGAFPTKEDRIYSGLSNLAVGQGSLLVTPVQIARMTNIVASGGIDYPVSVTMSKESQEAEGKRVMTQVTAMEVSQMMQRVFEAGTASGASLSVKAAGKTGSAESGNNGAYTVHGWFTGFFPADNPEYTVTVIAENGKTGSSSALPVFEEIVNSLY